MPLTWPRELRYATRPGAEGHRLGRKPSQNYSAIFRPNSGNLGGWRGAGRGAQSGSGHRISDRRRYAALSSCERCPRCGRNLAKISGSGFRRFEKIAACGFQARGPALKVATSMPSRSAINAAGIRANSSSASSPNWAVVGVNGISYLWRHMCPGALAAP